MKIDGSKVIMRWKRRSLNLLIYFKFLIAELPRRVWVVLAGTPIAVGPQRTERIDAALYLTSTGGASLDVLGVRGSVSSHSSVVTEFSSRAPRFSRGALSDDEMRASDAGEVAGSDRDRLT